MGTKKEVDRISDHARVKIREARKRNQKARIAKAKHDARERLDDRELRQQWRTPPELFALLDAEFHFVVDVAARAENALCEEWYGPGSPFFSDARAMSCWSHDGSCFCNPGFSDPMPWHKLAWQTALHGGVSVALVGLVGASQAWYEFVYFHSSEIRVLAPRAQYLKPIGSKIKPSSNMRETSITIYTPESDPLTPTKTRLWKWKEGILL